MLVLLFIVLTLIAICCELFPNQIVKYLPPGWIYFLLIIRTIYGLGIIGLIVYWILK